MKPDNESKLQGAVVMKRVGIEMEQKKNKATYGGVTSV
jgi:hypothetical protein